jgi:hypothetical protein
MHACDKSYLLAYISSIINTFSQMSFEKRVSARKFASVDMYPSVETRESSNVERPRYLCRVCDIRWRHSFGC